MTSTGHKSCFVSVNESERLLILRQDLVEPFLVYDVFATHRILVGLAVFIQADNECWTLNRIETEIFFPLRRLTRKSVRSGKDFPPYARRIGNRFSIVIIRADISVDFMISTNGPYFHFVRVEIGHDVTPLFQAIFQSIRVRVVHISDVTRPKQDRSVLVQNIPGNGPRNHLIDAVVIAGAMRVPGIVSPTISGHGNSKWLTMR